MTVHLFGAVSSPSCANFVLRKTADDNEGKAFSECFSTISNNFYVDDSLESVMLVQELTAACVNGGFKLTKWFSNSHAVLASILDKKRSKEVKHLDLQRDELPVNSTIRLHWNTESDTFLFKIALKQQQFTRRGILSATNSVYDPCGLLALVMLPAINTDQELCWMNYGWKKNGTSG